MPDATPPLFAAAVVCRYRRRAYAAPDVAADFQLSSALFGFSALQFLLLFFSAFSSAFLFRLSTMEGSMPGCIQF